MRLGISEINQVFDIQIIPFSLLIPETVVQSGEFPDRDY
jgi:hypothetical protein